MPSADDHITLAYALINLADVAGMPDSYWNTDSRITLARKALGMDGDAYDRPTVEELAARHMEAQA